MTSGMFMGQRQGKHLAHVSLGQAAHLGLWFSPALQSCPAPPVKLLPLAPPACPLSLAEITGWIPLSLGSLVESLMEPYPLALSIFPITQESGQILGHLLASPPPHLGLYLYIPHPQSFIPCSSSVTALSTSLEEVSESWETATCWGVPAALSLVAGADTTHGIQGT